MARINAQLSVLAGQYDEFGRARENQLFGAYDINSERRSHY
jgi:hypothetical protein